MCCLNIQVNIVVLKKNETINEELSECLREFQQHIPDDSHTILVGDCKRRLTDRPAYHSRNTCDPAYRLWYFGSSAAAAMAWQLPR